MIKNFQFSTKEILEILLKHLKKDGDIDVMDMNAQTKKYELHYINKGASGKTDMYLEILIKDLE